jgi:hypothetical protein
MADRDFEQRARAELKRGIDATPPAVRARLDAVVVRALRERPARFRAFHYALPAGAVAIVAGILAGQQMRVPSAPPAPAADDLALLLNVDNLDLLEQMEFYQWLDRQPGVLDEVAPVPVEAAQRS